MPIAADKGLMPDYPTAPSFQNGAPPARVEELTTGLSGSFDLDRFIEILQADDTTAPVPQQTAMPGSQNQEVFQQSNGGISIELGGSSFAVAPITAQPQYV
eukprot:scaffold198532_cov35-Prasinocladus_malaysianus.AAC.1